MSDMRARLAAALREIDEETTGGDLSARSSTGPEDWADRLLSLPAESRIAIVDMDADIDHVANAMSLTATGIGLQFVSEATANEFRNMAHAALLAAADDAAEEAK